MAEQRTLDLTDPADLGYIEALVDIAPRVLPLRDGPDGLTDFWRGVIRGLLALAKSQPAARPGVRPGPLDDGRMESRVDIKTDEAGPS